MRDLSPSAEVVALLLALHSLGCEDDEDGVLEQEVADKNTAKFIVIPLFMLRPALALRLVQLSHKPQTILVSVMSELVLEQSLVKIESFDRVGRRVWKLQEQSFDYMPGLAVLLNEAEDLVDLVGNDVSVLVLVVLHVPLFLTARPRKVVHVLLHAF